MNLIKAERTALGVTAEGGHLECLEYLIQAGADVNFTDESTKTCTPVRYKFHRYLVLIKKSVLID